MNLRNYILDNQFKIILFKDKVNVVNYLQIDSFDDTKIIIRYKEGVLLVCGNNLIISKLLEEELLISGDILKVEFR